MSLKWVHSSYLDSTQELGEILHLLAKVRLHHLNLCPPETSAFLSVLLATPFPLASRKTSASSLVKGVRAFHLDQTTYVQTATHMSKMACQEVAKAKIFARLASTFFAFVPTSATLMENNGFRAAIATISAVEVLPTPGGPGCCQQNYYQARHETCTIKQHY